MRSTPRRNFEGIAKAQAARSRQRPQARSEQQRRRAGKLVTAWNRRCCPRGSLNPGSRKRERACVDGCRPSGSSGNGHQPEAARLPGIAPTMPHWPAPAISGRRRNSREVVAGFVHRCVSHRITNRQSRITAFRGNAMARNLTQEQDVVAERAQVAGSAYSLVAAEYAGVTVAQLTEMRRKARQEGVFLKVAKSTL